MRSASRNEVELVVAAVWNELLELVGPVMLKDPTRSGEGTVGLGSAVVLEIGDKLIAVTAAHNFEHGDRLAYGLLPKWSSSIDAVTWLRQREVTTAGGESFDAHDFAVFEVSRAELETWGLKPLPLDRVLVHELSDNEFALLHGFPFEQADIEYGGSKVRTRHMTFATAALPRSEWDTRYKAGTHLLLRYPRDAGSVLRIAGEDNVGDTLPNPGGISGSGVWIVADRPGRLFAPRDLSLVGIESAWNTRQDFILANTMAPVLSVIQRAFPTLAPFDSKAQVVVQKSRE